jgi:hypothetical protein
LGERVYPMIRNNGVKIKKVSSKEETNLKHAEKNTICVGK